MSCPWPFPDLSLGGLQVGPDGDLLMCDGAEEARQRVARRVLSNPRQVLADGTVLPPDNLFDPQYGVGVRRMIGQAVNAAGIDKLRQLIRDGMIVEDTVSSNPPPDVLIQSTNNNIFFIAAFVPAGSASPTSTPKIPLT